MIANQPRQIVYQDQQSGDKIKSLTPFFFDSLRCMHGYSGVHQMFWPHGCFFFLRVDCMQRRTLFWLTKVEREISISFLHRNATYTMSI